MPPTSDSKANVLTISACYGAGGSVVAPRSAERLGVPFFDRLLPTHDTPSVDKITERLTNEERRQAPPGRIVAGLSSMTGALGLSVPDSTDLDPLNTLRRQVEASVTRVATTTGGVILGRAAAIVLADYPRAFHVRLQGPPDRCLAQGMTLEGVSGSVARSNQADADRAWTRFVKRLFDRDSSDPRLYHLVVDSTVLPLEYCVTLVAEAAEAFWAAVPATA
jgi:cytidylate kinase